MRGGGAGAKSEGGAGAKSEGPPEGGRGRCKESGGGGSGQVLNLHCKEWGLAIGGWSERRGP